LKAARRFGDLTRIADIAQAAGLENKTPEEMQAICSRLAALVTQSLDTDEVKKPRLLNVSFNPRELHQVKRCSVKHTILCK
jgi:hypothetical protein